jgi:hypothetical protein
LSIGDSITVISERRCLDNTSGRERNGKEEKKSLEIFHVFPLSLEMGYLVK